MSTDTTKHGIKLPPLISTDHLHSFLDVKIIEKIEHFYAVREVDPMTGRYLKNYSIHDKEGALLLSGFKNNFVFQQLTGFANVSGASIYFGAVPIHFILEFFTTLMLLHNSIHQNNKVMIFESIDQFMKRLNNNINVDTHSIGLHPACTSYKGFCDTLICHIESFFEHGTLQVVKEIVSIIRIFYTSFEISLENVE